MSLEYIGLMERSGKAACLLQRKPWTGEPFDSIY